MASANPGLPSNWHPGFVQSKASLFRLSDKEMEEDITEELFPSRPTSPLQMSPTVRAAAPWGAGDLSDHLGKGGSFKKPAVELSSRPASPAISPGDTGTRLTSTRQHTSCQMCWLYPDLPWGLPPTPEIQKNLVGQWRRGADFLKIWEFFTATACLYVGVMVPLTLGFERLYLKDEDGDGQCLFKHGGDSSIPEFLVVVRYVDVAVDIIFWFDIALNFVTARWMLITEPIPHWSLMDKVRDVRAHYLRGLFFWDMLGSVPVQYIDCIPGAQTGALKLMRLCRLFKLLRLSRLKNVVKALQKKFPESVYFVTFIELFLYFFLFAHWTGCIFFAIAYGVGDPHGTDFQRHLFLGGWIHQDGLLDEEGNPTPYAEPYLASIYWAVTTMSTIGYGDISPTTWPERLLGMLLMASGCAFFAWITGRITQILTQRSLGETRFENLVDDLETFMANRNFPLELRERVLDFYKVKYPHKIVFDEQAIIHDIESPSIRRDVQQQLFFDVISRAALFELCGAETRKDICTRLRSGYRMPGMQLTRAGSIPDAMYVVRFGTMRLHAQCHGIARDYGPGELFGEIALLGLSPDGLRVRTSVAQSVVEYCELKRHDLHDLLLAHESMRQLLLHISQIHLADVRRAGHRAIAAAAKADEAVADAFRKKHTVREIEKKQAVTRALEEEKHEYLSLLTHLRWGNIKDTILELQVQL